MGEHFAVRRGYNVLLFGLVDESCANKFNFLYGKRILLRVLIMLQAFLSLSDEYFRCSY